MKRLMPGFSLVEVLVAAGLCALVAISVSQLMKGMSRNVASVTQRTEADEIRLMLMRRLSCSRTFPTGVCTPGPRGQVVLKDPSDNDIFTEYDDTPASDPVKGIFRDSFKWATTMARIRTSCGTNSLEVRVVSYMTPEKAWPPVAPVQVCQEVLGGPPPACPAGDAPIVIEGESRCTQRKSICDALGYNWDAGSLSCYPPVKHVYGGGFQRGENPVKGPPDCETWNPETSACTCPAGFTPYDAGFTVEPDGMWDRNFICLRSN